MLALAGWTAPKESVPMKPLALALTIPFLVHSVAVQAVAQGEILVGPQALMGVPIGTEAEAAVAGLVAALGPAEDSGWIDGCELNGVRERYLAWGGLTAAFEETSEVGNVFVNWSYALDRETGAVIPGGPAPDAIVLPKGLHPGDAFSAAAAAYGFDPMVGEMFGIGIYANQYFEMMTATDDLDGPIASVAVPHFSYCE
jgi:hypothetical protein